MSARLVVLAVGLAALLVHLPARKGGFLYYDDPRFVVRNREIERVGNPVRFFTDLDTTAAADAPTKDIYRPVRTLSYAILTQLGGKDPALFHGLSILLHAACAALLALLLLQAGLPRWPAAAGALAFAFHPATVETTAWICSLGDTWCGFFVLLSMLLYARDRWLLAHLALLGALFSKEHAVVVPGLWLAWDFFLRRERLRGGWLLRGPALGLALAIGFLFFRASLGAGMRQIPEPLGGSHGTAVLTMLAGLGWYAATVFFPYGPTFDARVPIQETPFSLPVLLGLGVSFLLVLGLLRGPRLVRLACAWFLIGLVPASNIFVPLKIPTADRFLYIPLMGGAIAAAELCRLTTPRSVRVAPAALLVLAFLTIARIGDWRDDASLIAAGTRVNPRSKPLVWAEASLKARQAIEHLEKGNGAIGGPLAEQATQLYQVFLKNSVPAEQIQVYMELGELWMAVGRWSERYDPQEKHRRYYSRALEAFRDAHERQKRGLGRVIEEEVEVAATHASQLAILLAQAENPRRVETIKFGFDMLRFIEQRFGRDITAPFCKLLLIASIEKRARQPAEARKGFDFVESKFDELDKKGVWTTFLRGQVLLYRSVLKDRDPNRVGLENAYALFRRAAQENRLFRLEALYRAGLSACLIWDKFQDAKWLDLGKRILDSIPEVARRDGLRLTSALRAYIHTRRSKYE